MIAILWDILKTGLKGIGMMTWITLAVGIIAIPLGVYFAAHLLADLKDYH